MNRFLKTCSTIATTLVTTLACNLSLAADLTVNIENIKSSDGNLMVAIYDSAANFLKNPLQAAKMTAQPGNDTVQFKDLPAGEYAVVVYHDANGNGQLDKNAFGMPLEDYGFSNNTIGKTARPSFDAAKMGVLAAGTRIVLKMQ
ncbi:MAG: hypothetical protein RL748_3850 [Pseudomonadota bacterium]|jgi:uncharacterized protein (DUF2141 family)